MVQLNIISISNTVYKHSIGLADLLNCMSSLLYKTHVNCLSKEREI